MLKPLISSLLSRFYSKSESDLVSQQAIPDYTHHTELSLPPNENTLESIDYAFVAPNNGYVCLLDRGGTPRNQSSILCNDIVSGSYHPNLNIDSYVMFAVKKGQTYIVRYCGNNSVVRFCRTIGGGYNSLFKQFRRVSVCLKTFLNCSLKHSSRIRNLGFKVPLLLGMTEPLYCLGSSLQIIKQSSSWLQKAGYFSVSFAQGFRTKSGLFATHTIKELLELFGKIVVQRIGLNSSTEWRKGSNTESLSRGECRPKTRLRSYRLTEACGGALC